MSTFKKGAIATVTAAALTVGVVTPASAEDKLESYSTSYKDNICTVETTYPNGEKTTDTLTSNEAQDDLNVALKAVKQYQVQLKENQDKLAKAKKEKESTENLEEIQAEINRLTKLVKTYSKYRVVYKACAEGKSLSKTDIDAQALLSSPDGESLSPAGIGVVVAGVVVVVLGAIVAALPMLKPMLPPQIAAMLP
ncbi:hypothetical protein [Corynebacterium glucuronolyticum]|uniref:Uncharacterized protein n=2 Tax=Corynebacterium glucuronolyticum TaxID=39791 RepID=A0AAX1L839_9CORY|nr:hypothetical protein [Corynebacterium glucuronolyticum]EEI64440.1 hypothetical protein HMPREF0293_0075 [Corynebacterium glucuronolyticum ATCC 51866]MCT1443480.1 hypothetical protein [Corynebacterium glucuronolyticum]QRP70430.1 hypothetical protein I6J21_11870 [Corynebacterium glucuronolyticum]